MMLKRDRQPEWMDDPNLPDDDHLAALTGLARLNQVSGIGRLMYRHIRRMAMARPNRRLNLLDVASGSGDLPVDWARRARQEGWTLQVTMTDNRTLAIEEQQRRRVVTTWMYFHFSMTAFSHPFLAASTSSLHRSSCIISTITRPSACCSPCSRQARARWSFAIWNAHARTCSWSGPPRPSCRGRRSCITMRQQACEPRSQRTSSSVWPKRPCPGPFASPARSPADSLPARRRQWSWNRSPHSPNGTLRASRWSGMIERENGELCLSPFGFFPFCFLPFWLSFEIRYDVVGKGRSGECSLMAVRRACQDPCW